MTKIAIDSMGKPFISSIPSQNKWTVKQFMLDNKWKYLRDGIKEALEVNGIFGVSGLVDDAILRIKYLRKINYHHRARGINPENCIHQPNNPKHVCCNGCCE